MTGSSLRRGRGLDQGRGRSVELGTACEKLLTLKCGTQNTELVLIGRS